VSCLIRGDHIRRDRSHQFSESELPAEAKGGNVKLVAAAQTAPHRPCRLPSTSVGKISNREKYPTNNIRQTVPGSSRSAPSDQTASRFRNSRDVTTLENRLNATGFIEWHHSSLSRQSIDGLAGALFSGYSLKIAACRPLTHSFQCPIPGAPSPWQSRAKSREGQEAHEAAPA
jgi:hypothetical protein